MPGKHTARDERKWRETLINIFTNLGAIEPAGATTQEIVEKAKALRHFNVNAQNVKGKLQDFCPTSGVFKLRNNPGIIIHLGESRWSLHNDWERLLLEHGRTSKKKQPDKVEKKQPDKPERKYRTELTPELEAEIIDLVFAQKIGNETVAHKLKSSERLIHYVVGREEGRREILSKVNTGSLTASQKMKFDIVVEKTARQLKNQFEQRVEEEIKNRLDEKVLPYHKRVNAEYEAVIKARKGIMDKPTYNKIRSCLHPDWVTDGAQKARYAEAFDLFSQLERLMLNEKESPSSWMAPLPSSFAELMAARRKAEEDRKARRTAVRVS